MSRRATTAPEFAPGSPLRGLRRELTTWYVVTLCIVLVVLGCAVVLVTIVAWFAILLTGRYPRAMFDFVVGVMRWGVRVWAYAILLATDVYPPFSLS